MQYRFENVYNYFCKLLRFPREALRKEPSKFRQNQKNKLRTDVRTYAINKLVGRPLQGQQSGPSEGNKVFT